MEKTRRLAGEPEHLGPRDFTLTLQLARGREATCLRLDLRWLGRLDRRAVHRGLHREPQLAKGLQQLPLPWPL